MPARRRSAGFATLALLLTTACGSEPKPLTAMKPEVPADLCATVPESARQGLVTNAHTDESRNPTAACSLRSPDAAATEVRAVVTWLQANDEISADEVMASQCRSIDRSKFREQNGFRAAGAEEACAASGSVDGADSATIAAVNGLEVVTVRVTSLPPGKAPALGRAQQMLEGVLSALAGES